jgi:hypothetical protein
MKVLVSCFACYAVGFKVPFIILIDCYYISIFRFEKSTFQKEKKLDESEFPVVNLVTDILTSLHRHKLTDEEQLAPLPLFQFLFRYGIQYDIVKASGISHSIPLHFQLHIQQLLRCHIVYHI